MQIARQRGALDKFDPRRGERRTDGRLAASGETGESQRRAEERDPCPTKDLDG